MLISPMLFIVRGSRSLVSPRRVLRPPLPRHGVTALCETADEAAQFLQPHHGKPHPAVAAALLAARLRFDLIEIELRAVHLRADDGAIDIGEPPAFAANRTKLLIVGQIAHLDRRLPVSPSPEVLGRGNARIADLAAGMAASRWLPFAKADDGAGIARVQRVDGTVHLLLSPEQVVTSPSMSISPFVRRREVVEGDPRPGRWSRHADSPGARAPKGSAARTGMAWSSLTTARWCLPIHDPSVTDNHSQTPPA